MCYLVVQWATVGLVLIFECIIALQIQNIDFQNSFAWMDIPRGGQVIFGIPRYFNINWRQRDAVLLLKKILCGQAKSACLWYKKLLNDLLDCGFVVIKSVPYLFISKTVICVTCVYYCIFWKCSQSDIDKFLKSFKYFGTSYNWIFSKGDSVSELLVIDTSTLDYGGFQFYRNGFILKGLEVTGV